jgi:hypothetical protein
VKKYTLPRPKQQVRARFSQRERRLRPSSRNFSRITNSSAGPMGASQMKNCPSRTCSALPARYTSGSSNSAGNAGKGTYHLPSYWEKSLLPA